MLVVIEGPDGVGKDTVADGLAQSLNAARLNFPNDQGVTGPMIRAYLRKEWYVQPASVENTRRTLDADQLRYSALALQALMVANRLEAHAYLKRFAKSTKRHLVVCRYWQSGWVYGQLDGLSRDFLYSQGRALLQADANVFLDANPETCMERRASRDGAQAPERYEGKLALTQRVVALYRELWAAERADEEQAAMRFGGLAEHEGRWLTVDTQVYSARDVTSQVEWLFIRRGWLPAVQAEMPLHK